MTRACIIVSPHFPPSTLAGVHRARHLAKHLPACGWTPIVLCVDEAFHEERLDPDLAALVPPATEIVKARAVPIRLTRPFGLGEISLRAWRSLRRELFRLLATRPIEAVLITGSPYYPMLLAAQIKRRFGVPVVLDFQDPWVSAWGAREPKLSKAGASHQLAVLLEPKALRSADFVTSVSEAQNAELAARYPWLDGARMAAVPIGGDPDDYGALPARIEEKADRAGDGLVQFSYVGTIWPPVLNTVRALLRGAAALRRSDRDLYQRLRFNFIGATANPNDTTSMRVIPLARAEGVGDIVSETPQRVPYMQALAAQAQADVILILGSDEPHYTASKLYSVLMSGRPYLSLFHRASSAHDILSRAGGGVALSFVTPDDLAALELPIAEAIARLARAPDSVGRADPAAYAAFCAPAIARRYADIFNTISADGERAN